MGKRRMQSFLGFWDSALGKALMRLTVFLAAIAVICFFGKYAFFESCISTLGIHNCTSAAAVGSDSIVAIGALLVAIISLIPLFSIESRVSDAKKEVERRVYTQLEQSLELVPQAYELLRLQEEVCMKTDLGTLSTLRTRRWPFGLGISKKSLTLGEVPLPRI